MKPNFKTYKNPNFWDQIPRLPKNFKFWYQIPILSINQFLNFEKDQICSIKKYLFNLSISHQDPIEAKFCKKKIRRIYLFKDFKDSTLYF